MVATAERTGIGAIGTRAGRSEKLVRRDPATGREIWQMTRAADKSFHSYYDLCPWNAAGDKIVFCAEVPDVPGSDVYWMDAEDGTLHFVGHSARRSAHTGVHQQWIGHDDIIAYEDSDASGRFVRLVDLGGREVGRLPGAARMVSPDGTRVASHTDHTDEAAIMRRAEAGVYVAALRADGGSGEAGRHPRLIAPIQAALDLNPRRDEIGGCHLYVKHAKFSPDNRRLMFVFTNELTYEVTYGEPRVKDIYVVDPDGANLRFVCHFTWGNHPSWHPNGRQILFNGRFGPGGSTERTDPLAFVLADVESGRVAPATTLAPGGGHPPYSPDGTRIAAEYVTRAPGQPGRADPGGSARIACVDLVRQHTEDLAHFTVRDHSHQGTHIHPTWSRDGRRLLFNVDESGHSEIWVVPMDAR